MAGLVGTGARPPVVNVYHEKSRILPDVSRVLACLYEKDVKFETIKASYKDLLSLQVIPVFCLAITFVHLVGPISCFMFVPSSSVSTGV
jgi:hypothetical protein